MKELLYCLFYIKSLQQARELGEEETSERLGRMDQSGASILPRKTAGPVPYFYKGNGPYGLFDNNKYKIYLIFIRFFYYIRVLSLGFPSLGARWPPWYHVP
jgi:hypothetical protein